MRMRVLVWLLGTAALLGGAVTHAADHARPPIRVVYQVDADSKGTTTALHQMKNQLAAAPDTKIVAVVMGDSVRFLVDGAQTDGGYPYALMISDLQDRGVRFEACANSMNSLHIKAEQLDPGVHVVPSGMAEIARLQAREGYVYLRP